ncbi:MerR family transcriptional regulator [Rhodovulum sp. DZ06]|uniref:MerR family transcriptional regulator n=1 Tax=Rhodovulum sp. DZ06 TaxID=3425126 RepID=UPI003D35044E
MTEELSTISQMCAEYGVTPRTLRFYEYKGLLNPRREGQKRLFTYRDKARIQLILRGKRFGFSLDEIRELLDLYYLDDGQSTQLTRTYLKAQERLQAMIAQRDELTEAIDDLANELKRHEGSLRARGLLPDQQDAGSETAD